MFAVFFYPIDPSVQAAELLGYDRSGPAGVSGWRTPLPAQEQPGVHLQQNRLGHGCAGKHGSSVCAALYTPPGNTREAPSFPQTHSDTITFP